MVNEFGWGKVEKLGSIEIDIGVKFDIIDLEPFGDVLGRPVSDVFGDELEKLLIINH